MSQLMNQGIAGHSGQEGSYHVGFGDIGKLVALSEEASDVPMKGLTSLMVTIIGIPWVPRAFVCALEVFHKDLLQICLTLDCVGRKVFQPRPGRIGQEQWEVADNEVIIIRTTGLIGKPIVFQPKAGVCLPGVFRDVGRWSIPWRECSIEDVPAEGLRPWQARARAPVLATIVASAVSRMIAVAGSFPWVAVGAPAGIDGAACVVIAAETLMYLGHNVPPAALWCLVD